MKWQTVALLATLFVLGCGESNQVPNPETLAVTFFGVDLWTQHPLDTRSIPLKHIPPGLKSTGVFTISPCVKIEPTEDDFVIVARDVHRIPELAEDVWCAAMTKTLKQIPEHVEYYISRDQNGTLSVRASLVPAKDVDNQDAVDDIESPSLPLVPREGESGVFLLPDETRPRYAVCFVVTSAPPRGSEKGESKKIESGPEDFKPSGGSQRESQGAQ